MNEIKLKVNFEKRTLIKTGVDLTANDYNSTKLVFEFDKPEGTKVFEMANPSGELILLQTIENNEVILTGKTEEGKDASLFTEEGQYVFEISLYDGDSKLTSASGKLRVKAEQVQVNGEVVTQYLPLFDELLGQVKDAVEEVDTLKNKVIEEVNTLKDDVTKEINTLKDTTIKDCASATENANEMATKASNAADDAISATAKANEAIRKTENINISVNKVDTTSTITIIDKEGQSKSVEILDGEVGPIGPQGPQGLKGEQGLQGPQGDIGPTGPAPKITMGEVETLSPDEKAKATISGSDGEYELSFSIPQGLKGEQGNQGEKGLQGDKGDKGEKGDAFTYEMFTPEQLGLLKGPQGDKGDKGEKGDTGAPFTYDMFTEDQLEGLKGPQGLQGDPGPKGDAFTYKDFTPEQLEALKGPKGDKGEEGPQGPAGLQGPAGNPGEDGAPGKDGISPTISTEDIGTGTKVTITDAQGSKDFTILNGKDGAPGATGPQGPEGPVPENVSEFKNDANYATEEYVKGLFVNPTFEKGVQLQDEASVLGGNMSILQGFQFIEAINSELPYCSVITGSKLNRVSEETFSSISNHNFVCINTNLDLITELDLNNCWSYQAYSKNEYLNTMEQNFGVRCDGVVFTKGNIVPAFIRGAGELDAIGLSRENPNAVVYVEDV